MKDKFKAMVERAIARGYNIGNIKNCTIWFIHHKNVYSSTIPILVIDHTYTKSAVMRADEGLIESPPHIRYGDIYYYTLSDLLFNHEFMRALFGERYENKMFNAMTKETDEQRIDYVHGLIKGDD